MLARIDTIDYSAPHPAGLGIRQSSATEIERQTKPRTLLPRRAPMESEGGPWSVWMNDCKTDVLLGLMTCAREPK
jgi:hypothetical protein